MLCHRNRAGVGLFGYTPLGDEKIQSCKFHTEIAQALSLPLKAKSENVMMLGVIPARFASSRFPGKPLVDILGKTMIRRVYEQALQSTCLNRVVVATDDERIASEVQAFGGEWVMTSPDHPSGTDRCAETARILDLGNHDVVINIQGDEPYIDPGQIDQLGACFNDATVQLATLVKSFRSLEEVNNPSTIKVVCDTQGNALYFSRAPIPFFRDADQPSISQYTQHIGIYGYRAGVLQDVALLPPSRLELAEKLEQLRWLENGYAIRTARSEHQSWSVDTPDDLQKILAHFSGI